MPAQLARGAVTDSEGEKRRRRRTPFPQPHAGVNEAVRNLIIARCHIQRQIAVNLLRFHLVAQFRIINGLGAGRQLGARVFCSLPSCLLLITPGPIFGNNVSGFMPGDFEIGRLSAFRISISRLADRLDDDDASTGQSALPG